jgi:hypothetical protein
VKYYDEIWKQQATKYVAHVKELLAPGFKMGFKKMRGEVNIPSTLVMEMLREAYRAGAEQALTMANDLDAAKREIDESHE